MSTKAKNRSKKSTKKQAEKDESSQKEGKKNIPSDAQKEDKKDVPNDVQKDANTSLSESSSKTDVSPKSLQSQKDQKTKKTEDAKNAKKPSKQSQSSIKKKLEETTNSKKAQKFKKKKKQSPIQYIVLAIICMGLLGLGIWFAYDNNLLYNLDQQQEETSMQSGNEDSDKNAESQDDVSNTQKREISAKLKVDMPIEESFIEGLQQASAKAKKTDKTSEGETDEDNSSKNDSESSSEDSANPPTQNGESPDDSNNANDASNPETGNPYDRYAFVPSTIRVQSTDGSTHHISLSGDFDYDISGISIWYFGKTHLYTIAKEYNLGQRVILGTLDNSKTSDPAKPVIKSQSLLKIGQPWNVKHDIFALRSYCSSSTSCLEVFYYDIEQKEIIRVPFVDKEGNKNKWVGDSASKSKITAIRQGEGLMGITTTEYNNVTGVYTHTNWMYEEIEADVQHEDKAKNDDSLVRYVLTYSDEHTEKL
jgi:hypothetical protein